MWTAYTAGGEQFNEGTHPWNDVRYKSIVKLESVFGNRKVTVEIPEDTTPVVFNTGELIIEQGRSKKHRQISQSIGYANDEQECYTRIFYDGRVKQEVGPVIH